MTYEPDAQSHVVAERTTWNADDSFTTIKDEVHNNGSTSRTETEERADGSWESHRIDRDANGEIQHEKTETSGTSRDADGHKVDTKTKSETWSDGATKSSSTTYDRGTGRTTRTESSDDGAGNRDSREEIDDRSSTFSGAGPIRETHTTTDSRTGETTKTTTSVDEDGNISSHVITTDANGNVIDDRTYGPPPAPTDAGAPPTGAPAPDPNSGASVPGTDGTDEMSAPLSSSNGSATQTDDGAHGGMSAPGTDGSEGMSVPADTGGMSIGADEHSQDDDFDDMMDDQ